MKKSFAVIAVAGLAAAASGQFSLSITGENATDAGRGLTAAAPGDVINFAIRFDETSEAHGMAGGFLSIVSEGINDGDFDLTEDSNDQGNNFPPAPPFDNSFNSGRHPFFARAISDGTEPNPNDNAFNNLVTAQGGVITDHGGDGFFDLADFPPAGIVTNPFGVTNPINGTDVLRFSYTYNGGTDTLGLEVRDIAGLQIWETAQSEAPTGIPGSEVETGSLTVSPAPSSIALLGLGGLAAARRRRA